MRLAACALSAVLMSGCSWMGSGGQQNSSYGYGYNGVYNGCSANTGSASYANSNYGYTGAANCAQGAGHGAAQGQQAHRGHHQGQHGLRGQHGVNAYGAGQQSAHMQGGMYGGQTMGQGGTGMIGHGQGITTLGGAAPYGSAVGGASSHMTAQGGNVRTVQGAPIYVAQPYPAYYNAGAAYGGSSYSGGYNYGGGYSYGGYGAGGGMPFGLELGAGTDLSIGGNIFPGEVAKPFLGGPGMVSDLAPIAYDDAWENAKGGDLAMTYDINPNTTLLGRVGYSKANGNRILAGTVDDGAGTTEDLYAEFSDLEQYTVEGGMRHYMGTPTGLRPYVGATAGFVKTEDVTLTQSSSTLVDPALFQQTYVDGGWSPTASGVIGAEFAVGNTAALGVETGIRWTDDLDTNFKSDDRWTVPVRLRGRVAF